MNRSPDIWSCLEKFINISLYTTFLVKKLGWSIATLILRMLETLDKATYNCPCVKTWSGPSHKETNSSVWPCDLLMVMQKHGLIGNWFLWKSNGKYEFVGISGILGINTTLFWYAPLKIL